jgi:AbrB family looped-hinge helix DNA binding protein
MTAFSSFHTRLGDDGRVVIPAPLRKELGLHPGDTIVLDVDDRGLHLRSLAQVVKEVQDAFAPYRRPGASVVDELIEERRAEAARDEAEEKAWLAGRQHE